MVKARTAYVCSDCGARHPKWQGACSACGAWNTLAEYVVQPRVESATRYSGYAGSPETAQVMALGAVAMETSAHTLTGMAELDRVLGHGLMDGSVVLIGGDPGIGKSTLLLQMLGRLGTRLPALYVTGEESLAQVAARAKRLELPLDPLKALAQTCVERILEQAVIVQPRVLIIDSIQTMWSELLAAPAGSVSQVRESAARLTRFAKETGTSVLLVGHVTKEGGIAGPRVLEHMVDAVLYFEGEIGSRFRVLRAFKNRFGAVNELGVFVMGEKGLREVANPSAIFLSARSEPASGSAVMVTREGTRPLLVEVQALVDQSSLGNPRRVSLGLEQNRLAMLLAVLHRHGGVAAHDQDVFVNVVGGIRVQETAADLPVLLAISSSLRDRPLPEKLVLFGEVGLSGEIRPVANGQERLKEAAQHGFKRAIVPSANVPKKKRVGELEVVAADTLGQALNAVG